MEEPILDQSNREDFPESFNQQEKESWFTTRRLVMLPAVLLTLLAIVAGLWYWRVNSPDAPTKANVVMQIEGPASLASGNEAEYRVKYTNGENTDLVGITLEVFYPANFKFASSEPEPTSASGQRFNLPVLRQGQSGEVVIKGKLSGATDEIKELRARLTFAMTNFSSEFTTDASIKTVLGSPELEMEITGPIDIVNGQSTTFTVNYKNVSNKEFDSTGIELDYPEGYKFSSSVPAASKGDNYWSLGKLGVGMGGKIEVTGTFVGDPGTEQEVAGSLGLALSSGMAPQLYSSARFKIKASSLTVTQKASSDVVKLGETLNVTLDYANFGATAQNNVVVSVTLDGSILDLPRIKTANGIVTGNTVTWKSATVSSLSLLSPNQKGQLMFSVPVKNTLSTNLKNQVIKSVSRVQSDQVSSPILGQEISVKLQSELTMNVSGEYVNGAIPMEVGKPTTFNVTVLLTNLGNDLSDTTVAASMPLPAASWVNVIVPDSEKGNVTFDRNASKIRWKVGNLAAFSGKYSPARSITFQLQVTPSESDRGRVMTLLRDLQATGKDTFADLDLSSTKLSQLNVADLDDDVIDAKGSAVQ